VSILVSARERVQNGRSNAKLAPIVISSVDLDRRVDFPNKETRSDITDGTTHDSQCNAKQSHITKIEGCLEKTIHFSLEEEVVERVYVDVSSSRSSGKETSPLPPIVFSIQQEVRADDCDTDGNNDKNDENQEHESIDVVDLVRPERRENKIHFNENRSKWQNST
jgi:hypothetical protein